MSLDDNTKVVLAAALVQHLPDYMGMERNALVQYLFDMALKNGMMKEAFEIRDMNEEVTKMAILEMQER